VWVGLGTEWPNSFSPPALTPLLNKESCNASLSVGVAGAGRVVLFRLATMPLTDAALCRHVYRRGCFADVMPYL
jgi:hypothetical protein